MSPTQYLVSPTKSTLKPAPLCHSEVRMSVERGVAEATAYIAQISTARRDFIALRKIFLEQITTTKVLIEAMDARISEHHKRLPGWKPNEGTF